MQNNVLFSKSFFHWVGKGVKFLSQETKWPEKWLQQSRQDYWDHTILPTKCTKHSFQRMTGLWNTWFNYWKVIWKTLQLWLRLIETRFFGISVLKRFCNEVKWSGVTLDSCKRTDELMAIVYNQVPLGKKSSLIVPCFCFSLSYFVAYVLFKTCLLLF